MHKHDEELMLDNNDRKIHKLKYPANMRQSGNELQNYWYQQMEKRGNSVLTWLLDIV